MEPQPKIVVTGIGLVTCLGLSAAEAGPRSLRGESGIGPLRYFDVSAHTCTAGACVQPLELTSRLRIPKNQKFMNRSVEFAMLAAKDAIAASHMDLDRMASNRIALHLGSGQSGLEPAEFFAALNLLVETGLPLNYKELGGRPARLIDRYFPLRTLPNAGSGLLSSEISARGPGNNFVQSDTGSALAIATAYYDLAEERCDVALAGGYDSLLTVSNYLAYESQGLLSAAAPERAYRPFDRERDGMVLGEGAAILVMERAEDAQRRGAAILGEIAGFGNSMDITDSAEPIGSEATARAACEQAMGKTPVDCVIAHGIGTPQGDRREAALLAAIFGSAIPITALKSQTGYVGAATAAVEIALGLMAVQQRLIPPIARHQHPDPDFTLDLVWGNARRISSATPSVLCLNWSWTGQCTALLARAFRE